MKSNLFIAEYFQYQACLNIEQGVNLWHLLNQVLHLGIPGDVVEFGSMTGMTAAVMGKTLQDFGSSKLLYLYDSFQGLPPIGPNDGNCGLIPENFATPMHHTVDRFNYWGLPQPIIISGWFADLKPIDLPDKICFAHVDGDLYTSTKEALNLIYPKLAPGAIVLMDDYAESELCRQISDAYAYNPYCKNAGRQCCPKDWLPGVRMACDEFLADKPEEMYVLLAGEERHAFFRKAGE